MPLRFRSVVPYTLPGVLALIGWWWYISRKKERLIRHDSLEGTPTAMGLKASTTEGSNGVVDKGTVSPTNGTESPTHRPAKDGNLRTEHENISQVHVQHTEAAPLQEQSSEEAAPHLGRIGQEEVHKPSVSPLPSPGEEETLQVSSEDHKYQEESSAPASLEEPEIRLVKDPASTPEDIVEDVIMPCQSTKVTSSPPTTTYLSDAERPEPEGEVAKQYSAVNSQDKILVCAVTPARVQMVRPSEGSTLETPPSEQDFKQHILTSTPASLGPEFTSVSEDVQVHSGCGEQQDLELLAAGLITEVISAATQEVLGVTSCQGTDSSTALDSGRLFSKEEPIIASAQHLLTSPPQTGCREEEQGIPNGCSSAPVWEPLEVSHEIHQTNHAQRSHWVTPSHQAALSSPSLSAKLKGEESAALTKTRPAARATLRTASATRTSRTACSTPSRLQTCQQEKPLRLKCWTRRPRRRQLAITEENSEDAVCDIKRLNGMGLRNGAHGTCEAETDQSGGSDVNSMDSVDSGCTMGAGEIQSNHGAASTSDLVIWEIEVPKHLVGRLIGKQGRYVSFLKQNSGAKIYISTLPYTQEFQICHIEGTQQQVDKALSLIGKKFKDLDLTNLYAPPPPPLTLPSLPMTSWLLLPSGVTVEVIVVNIMSAGHVFVQQHTHPTYHALRSLDQQMFLCYSQPGTPALPSPAEVGVICAAPAVEGAWWRAQVITFDKETNEVEIRYVDYGGYDRVKIDTLRQIRSDFVTLPFQGAEVLLDSIGPLPGEDRFSTEATAALEEMTRGVALLAQVSNYDNNTGLPLVHLWNMVGDEVISVNRTLAERGLGVWVEGF
ncbi:A-kinase anchor protein 1 mitochondrial [Dissostichus eleginoides]|uniref:A-kinase anchor protein 1 mitochondrial n=1 Tax=Dissostichus eleginoides TaxID=100907 RepID=A0AAD9CD74_DISEL|nr:A-kinase anchor protein 1 mitochondrial [Dissostichus eleginoides]